MKKLLFVLLTLIFFFQGFSQLDTFDIASYARPNLIRKTASIGAFSKTDNLFNTKDNTISFKLGTAINFNFFNSKFLNTPIYQSFVVNRIRSGMDFSVRSESTVEPQQTLQQRNASLVESELFRHFMRKKFSATTSFVEFNYQLNNTINYTSITNRDSLKNKSQYIDAAIGTGFNVSFFKGKGRIELVNDAWQAISILEALKKAGVLQKTVDSLSIQAFAERISDIKNFRNTDFRLEEIAVIEALCSYFFENELVTKDNALFYAVLLDAWNYESFVQRFSGKEIKFGVTPSLNILNNSNLIRTPGSDQKDRFDAFSPALALEVQYNRYKPISKEWQFNNTNRFATGVKSFYTENLSNPRYDEFFQFRTTWEWQYLPSQRTNYSIGVEQVIYDNDLSRSNTDETRLLHSNTSFYFDWYYYVSPKFSWSINGGLMLHLLGAKNTVVRYDQRLAVSTSYRLY